MYNIDLLVLYYNRIGTTTAPGVPGKLLELRKKIITGSWKTP